MPSAAQALLPDLGAMKKPTNWAGYTVSA